MARQDWNLQSLGEHIEMLRREWSLAQQGDQPIQRYTAVIEGLRKLQEDDLLTDELDMLLFAAEFNLAHEKGPD